MFAFPTQERSEVPSELPPRELNGVHFPSTTKDGACQTDENNTRDRQLAGQYEELLLTSTHSLGPGFITEPDGPLEDTSDQSQTLPPFIHLFVLVLGITCQALNSPS